MKFRPLEAKFFFYTDRQAGRQDMTRLLVLFFRNSAKAPKNVKTAPNISAFKLAAELF
jgi:hypothetical protein